MTDAFGPGSHVLTQEFIVPFGLTAATLQFSRYINNDTNHTGSIRVTGLVKLCWRGESTGASTFFLKPRMPLELPQTTS